MKKILLFFIAALFVATSSYGQNEFKLHTFARKIDGKVYLRWIPSDKQLAYNYKVFKKSISSAKSETLLADLSMISLETLEAKYKGDEFKRKSSLLYPESLYKDMKDKLLMLTQRQNQYAFALLLADIDHEFAKDLGLVYVDEDIEEGRSYQYRIEVYLDKNKVSESKFVFGNYDDYEMPIISAVNAERFPWGIGLNWLGFNNYSAFNIYRSEREKGEFIKINQQAIIVQFEQNDDGTFDKAPYLYTDVDVEQGKDYYYKVEGIDMFAQKTPLPTVPFKSYEVEPVRPLPVMKVDVATENNQIKLSWDKTKDKRIIGYNIYRAFDEKNKPVQINKELIAKNEYIDSSAKFATNYFYRVTAVWDNDVESVFSRPSFAYMRDSIAPESIGSLSAKAESGKIILTWDKSKETDLAGYEIYRADFKEEKDWAKLNKELIKENQYTDDLDKALDQDSYFYYVIAVDSSWNRAKAGNIIEQKLPDVTAPAVPVLKAINQKDETVEISWNQVQTKDLAGYNVYRKNEETFELLNKVLLTDNRFRFEVESNGEKLELAISSVDKANNESEKSKSYFVRTIDNVGPRIESFDIIAQGKDNLLQFSSDAKDLAGFIVYRSKGDGKFKRLNKSLIDSEYTDSNVKDGYSYKLEALDTRGNKTESDIIKK